MILHNLNLIMLVHYIKSMSVWNWCQNERIKWFISNSETFTCWNETDWSSDSASNQNISCCWVRRRVSRQMSVPLRWKVRPLMYYQAINSITEARSSIRMGFRDHLQGRFCAGSRLRLLPVRLDVCASVLILRIHSTNTGVALHHFLLSSSPVQFSCMNFVTDYFSPVTCSWDYLPLWRMST